MMNSQSQHVQKREIVDIQKIKYKYKSNKKSWSLQLNQKMLKYEDNRYSWTELNTNNSKISPWGRDLLGVQFKKKITFLAFQRPSPEGKCLRRRLHKIGPECRLPVWKVPPTRNRLASTCHQHCFEEMDQSSKSEIRRLEIHRAHQEGWNIVFTTYLFKVRYILANSFVPGKFVWTVVDSGYRD